MPLLKDPDHSELIEFLSNISPSLNTPTAIVVISAHWEEKQVTVTGGESPVLIYDYYGFPESTYQISYPALGNSALASSVAKALEESGIECHVDNERGFDHGMFVPLKLMYPKADIPCIQISLVKGLDPNFHIELGKALSALATDNILFIGSGLSFHNMKEFSPKGSSSVDLKNDEFQSWLIGCCTRDDISEVEREQMLRSWEEQPFARYCHPREEHLIPLHVCYGISQSSARTVFADKVIGKKACGFLW